MITKRLQQFIHLEASGGILLFLTLLLALGLSNSFLSVFHEHLVNLPIQIRIGLLNIDKPAILWVNDGLMAIFFMLLALEIKREVLEGELSKFSQLALPVVAALGGIVVPAAVYLFVNWHQPDARVGWPIATTTDIAFALGVIAILGRLVPPSLKVFLVALSIVDDILAVVIIAAFYTAQLSYLSLGIASVGVLVLLLMNFIGVTRIAAYVLVGLIVWVSVLQSGVHATLAGVIVGLCIPLRARNESGFSPLRHLEKILHPWVVFLILPLFVLANGAISLTGTDVSALLSKVPLGIILGLFLGKALGVFLPSMAAIKLNWAHLPKGSNALQLLALSSLTGIGFTMSLFLGSLAFQGTPYEMLMRQGVLIGSFLSLLLGAFLFLLAEQLGKH